MLPTLAEIEAARQGIAGTAIRTPLVRLNLDNAPAEIYLKLENLQPIGSFKIRGAANAIAHLPPDQLRRGVLTASAGNMAQGVAWVARELGVPCTVIAPETAPETKISAIERLGGQVIKVPFERWWLTFQERAYPGVDATFVHAFDDMHVMAGNGTIALEILEDLPGVNAVVIPWGGGGLTCGIAAALRATRPGCRLYAAEVATGAPLSAALATGTPQVAEFRALVRRWHWEQNRLSADARTGTQADRRRTGRRLGRSRGGAAPHGRAQPDHRRGRGRLLSRLRPDRQRGPRQDRVRGIGWQYRSE